MDESIINQIENLKNEKKTILEQANIDKRDLTEEEKQRCHVIDGELFNLENGKGFNPTGIIKTSVKVNITAQKDDTPIPHIELKHEQHDVYVPPKGAKEVMEYDKIHNVNAGASTLEYDPIMKELSSSIGASKTPFVPAPEVMQAPIQPEIAPDAAPAVEPAMPEVAPNVEPAIPESVPAPQSPVQPEPAPQSPVQPEPEPTDTKTKIFKNKGKIILIAIIVLLIGFKINRIISYQYESNALLGTVNGIYIYKYKHDGLVSINSIFTYEAKENYINLMEETYEKEGVFFIKLSDTKMFVIKKEKSTDDNWYYNKVTKADTKEACEKLNNEEASKCWTF